MTTKEYTNGEITILWKPEKCTHSGICPKTLPEETLTFDKLEKKILELQTRINGINQP